MSNILNVSPNKILKLQNVLIYKLSSEKSEESFIDNVVQQMENQVKVRGGLPLGPLIQKMNATLDNEGNLSMDITLIRQTDRYINKVDNIFTFQTKIVVRNCIYVRFSGLEHNLKYAYDKLRVYAYEENISLIGDSYTVFVDQNEEEGTIVADIFMPKAEEE